MIKFSEKDASPSTLADLVANEEMEIKVLLAFQEKLNNQVIEYTRSIVQNSFLNCSSPKLGEVSESFLDISKVLKISNEVLEQCKSLTKNIDSIKDNVLSHPKMQPATIKSKIEDYNRKYSEIDKKISSETLELQAFITDYEKNQILRQFIQNEKEEKEQLERQRLLDIIQKKSYKKSKIERSEKSKILEPIPVESTDSSEPIPVESTDNSEPILTKTPGTNSSIEDTAIQEVQPETQLFSPSDANDEEESLFDFDIEKENILENDLANSAEKSSMGENSKLIETPIKKEKKKITGFRNDLRPDPEKKARNLAESELPDVFEIDNLEKTLTEIDSEYPVQSSASIITDTSTTSEDSSDKISKESSANSETQLAPNISDDINKNTENTNNADIEITENTLIISEKNGTVTFPYTISELENKFTQNPEKYKDLKDIVKQEYTKPLNAYKNSAFARFREAYKLVRKKNKGSKKHALDLATEVFFKSNLHPAIISACKNVDELDIYLSCLEFDELEDFKIFNIVFDIAPAVYDKKKLAKQN